MKNYFFRGATLNFRTKLFVSVNVLKRLTFFGTVCIDKIDVESIYVSQEKQKISYIKKQPCQTVFTAGRVENKLQILLINHLEIMK